MKRVTLPPGIKDYSTDIVKKIDYINEIFFTETENWGYQKVLTPILENLDSLIHDSKDNSSSNILKMVDPLNGNILGIRSDVTQQILRYVISNFNLDNLPVKLSYSERVIRNNLTEKSNVREVFQIGCESIGTNGQIDDIETIQLASTLLKKIGFPKQVITLSSSYIVNFVLLQLPHCRENIKDLFSKKDFSSIKNLVKDKAIPTKERVFINKVVISLLQNKIPKNSLLNRKIKKEIDKIINLRNQLSKINKDVNFVVDLLDVKDFDYYSDITFEINVPQINVSLVKGGRYNNIFENYGVSIPAIGFALNIMPVVNSIKIDDLPKPAALVLINKKLSLSDLFVVRDFLSSQGFFVELSEKNHKNKKFQLIIKISTNKEIIIYDGEMRKILKFKSLKDFIEDEI